MPSAILVEAARQARSPNGETSAIEIAILVGTDNPKALAKTKGVISGVPTTTSKANGRNRLSVPAGPGSE